VPLLSVAPAALTIGDCTTNIPFIFSGGVPPYTVYTSDNFAVPVSSPLQLDVSRNYFTATINALNPSNIINPIPGPYTATFTVLDSQSHTATSTISVPTVHVACPANPVLAVLPESANFRSTEILAFQVSGGSSTSRVQGVTFSDAGVAKFTSSVETNSTTTTINIQAQSPGTTLMTITSSDGQKANIRLTVLPQ
jgi:hypothetical protein